MRVTEGRRERTEENVEPTIWARTLTVPVQRRLDPFRFPSRSQTRRYSTYGMTFWAGFGRGGQARTTVGQVSAQAARRLALRQIFEKGRPSALPSVSAGDLPAKHHLVAAGANHAALEMFPVRDIPRGMTSHRSAGSRCFWVNVTLTEVVAIQRNDQAKMSAPPSNNA